MTYIWLHKLNVDIKIVYIYRMAMWKKIVVNTYPYGSNPSKKTYDILDKQGGSTNDSPYLKPSDALSGRQVLWVAKSKSKDVLARYHMGKAERSDNTSHIWI